MWSTGLFSRCTERAQQAALSHSFEDSQRTEGCPGGCALMGKVSQHGHCRWCCLEMPFRGWAVIGRLAKFLLLRSSDHWQTRKNRISNVGLSHAGETSLGQRFDGPWSPFPPRDISGAYSPSLSPLCLPTATSGQDEAGN